MNERINLFGIEIDAVSMRQAVDQLIQWTDQAAHEQPDQHQPTRRCRFVVTPNVDHAVMLQEHQGLKRAYQQADLILADGHPVVLAARLLRKPLPERVPGSDLVPALLAAADKKTCRPLRIFLLGAAAGVADRAAENIHQQYHGVQVVGTYSPPLGFENKPAENQKILGLIAAARPDLLVVGLGAPKQELWVHQHCRQIEASVALCVGATIDFLAGEKSRAPRWVQKVGLEWLHRMLSEPRRLVKRYARDAWIFPQLVWREWWAAAR